LIGGRVAVVVRLADAMGVLRDGGFAASSA
jgi:hypothetical protein